MIVFETVFSRPGLKVLSGLSTEFTGVSILAAAASHANIALLTTQALVATIFAVIAFVCEWLLDTQHYE